MRAFLGSRVRLRTLPALLVLGGILLGTQAGVLAAPQISAFPDGDATSGKFVNLTNSLESLGEAGTEFCIEVPTGLAGNEFILQFFDGDYGGLWDFQRVVSPEVEYVLISDPEQDGDVTPGTVVATWSSTQMTNNDWFGCTSSNSSVGSAVSATGVVNNAAALDVAGDVYRYSLQVRWKTTPVGNAMNCFKIRAQGQVFGLRESRYGFIGFKWGAAFYGGGFPWTFDVPTLTFQNVQPPTTNYNGEWHFHLDLELPATTIDFWNGDFDVADDNDDVHATGIPVWAPSPPAQGEGENDGEPNDDLTYVDIDGNVLVHPYQITANLAGIYHQVSDEDRNWTATELNPSGNREWENFQIAVTGFGDNPEFTVSALPAGHYHWEMFGVDAQNTLFLRPEHNLFGELGEFSLGDRVWLDLDNSGTADDLSEPGINGVTVHLFVKINGIFVFYDSTVTQQVPDPNNAGQFIDGFYLFEDLAPGDYRAQVDSGTLPAGVIPTYDPDGTGTANVAEASITDQDRHDVDLSYFGSGSIGDFIWLDSDKDGVYDELAGELPISGVVVRLTADFNNDGTLDVNLTDTTDSDGLYLFENLPPGTYTVTVLSSNFASGAPLYRFVQTYDLDGTLDNKASYALSAAEEYLDVDFGYVPKCPPGTGTPGYWKNHPDAWPIEMIEIGGKEYTKAEAIAWLKTEDGDKTVTMFRALVCAKLNIGIGNNFSCIATTIVKADEWMADHPVGSNVAGSSKAWCKGEPLATTLDKYNNGLLSCAYSRDNVNCGCGGSHDGSTTKRTKRKRGGRTFWRWKSKRR